MPRPQGHLHNKVCIQVRMHQRLTFITHGISGAVKQPRLVRTLTVEASASHQFAAACRAPCCKHVTGQHVHIDARHQLPLWCRPCDASWACAEGASCSPLVTLPLPITLKTNKKQRRHCIHPCCYSQCLAVSSKEVSRCLLGLGN